MKKALLVGLAALSLGSMAAAQGNRGDYAPYGFSFKGGVFFPFDDALRGDRSIWGDLGLEFNIGRPFLGGSETFFEADYIFREFGSGDAAVPITLNERFYTSAGEEVTGGRTYFYAGLGFVWLTPSGRAEPVLHGGFGKEIGTNAFVEGSLYLAARDRGVSASGASIMIGYRFR